MRLTIAAVGLDLTDTTRTYVEEKIGKLEKLIVPAHRDSALADVKLLYAAHNTTATKDKCTVTISGLGEKHVVHIATEEPDMHAAIDAAAHRLKEPLRRFEERYRDHLSKDAVKAKQELRDDTDPKTDGVDEPGLEGDDSA
jgi:ribosomal subunit interface protein